MSFRRAAERLHIAQPALSQQIGKFERELHTELFHRTTRKVELIDAGEVLLAEGRRVLAGADHALSAVTQAAHGELGLLRVGIVREVDDVDGLVVRPLLRERLIVAVHESHALADRGSVELGELAGEPFLSFPRSRVSRLYDHIAALCHHAGFRLEVAQEAVQFPTLLGLAAARTGVTVVPESLRVLQLPGLRYLELTDPEAVSVVSIACRPDRERSPLVNGFLETAADLSL